MKVFEFTEVFGRQDTPLEDYMREVKEIKTLTDAQKFAKKFSLVLSDAAPVFDSLDELNFAEFLSELPKCFGNGSNGVLSNFSNE